MAMFNSYVSEIRCSWTTHNGGLLPFSGNVVVQGNPDLKLFHTGLDNKTGDGLKLVKPYKSIIYVYIYISPLKTKKKYLGAHEHPAESYTSYILWSSPGYQQWLPEIQHATRIASPSVGFIMVRSAWEHRGLPLSSTAWWLGLLQRLSMVHDVHDFFLKLSCYLQ